MTSSTAGFNHLYFHVVANGTLNDLTKIYGEIVACGTDNHHMLRLYQQWAPEYEEVSLLFGVFGMKLFLFVHFLTQLELLHTFLHTFDISIFRYNIYIHCTFLYTHYFASQSVTMVE